MKNLITFECLIWIVHGKNDFSKVYKNLIRYRSENNFGIINIINNY